MQNELKVAAEKAQAAYETEKGRLIAIGMKSKGRYEALKSLKAVADEAHATYKEVATQKALKKVRAHINQVNQEVRAERLARSPWKQAKAAAAAARIDHHE